MGLKGLQGADNLEFCFFLINDEGKHLFFVTDEGTTLGRAFVPGKPFHPTLIFVTSEPA